MSKEALLIIDYTNDFVSDKGTLTIGKSGQILEHSIISLANQFVDNDKWVILPTDLHHKNDPYHPETKLFPPHNLANTWGHQFYGQLQNWYNQNKSNDKVYMYNKTRYSAFAGTDLDLRLRERNINTLHLVGVCTDICILHTAIDAYNLNYNLIIHENGVAATNDAGQRFSLNHFKTCLGAKIEK